MITYKVLWVSWEYIPGAPSPAWDGKWQRIHKQRTSSRTKPTDGSSAMTENYRGDPMRMVREGLSEKVMLKLRTKKYKGGASHMKQSVGQITGKEH